MNLDIETISIDERFAPLRTNKNVTLIDGPISLHGIIGLKGTVLVALISIFLGFWQADECKSDLLMAGMSKDAA